MPGTRSNWHDLLITTSGSRPRGHGAPLSVSPSPAFAILRSTARSGPSRSNVSRRRADMESKNRARGDPRTRPRPAVSLLAGAGFAGTRRTSPHPTGSAALAPGSRPEPSGLGKRWSTTRCAASQPLAHGPWWVGRLGLSACWRGPVRVVHAEHRSEWCAGCWRRSGDAAANEPGTGLGIPPGYRRGRCAANNPSVRVRLLGPCPLRSTGPTQLGWPKQRAVFALLASNAGRVVSLDRLVHEL